MLIYTAHKHGNINVTTMSMRLVHYNIHIYAANECDYALRTCMLYARVPWTSFRVRRVVDSPNGVAVDEDAARPSARRLCRTSVPGFVVEINL